jgi:hypothetical protein
MRISLKNGGGGWPNLREIPQTGSGAAPSALNERLVFPRDCRNCQKKQARAVPILSGKMKEAASAWSHIPGGEAASRVSNVGPG